MDPEFLKPLISENLIMFTLKNFIVFRFYYGIT